MEEKFVLSIDDICKRYKIELIYDNTFIHNCPRCGGQVERKNISNIRISNLKSTPAAERRLKICQCSTCASKFTNKVLVVSSFRKLARTLEEDRICLELHIGEEKEKYKKRRNIEEKCFGEIWMKHGGSIQKYTIVEDAKKQNSAMNKLWIGRPKIQYAIMAIAAEKAGFRLRGEGSFFIEMWKGAQLEREIKERKKLCDPQSKVNVILYDGKLFCHPGFGEGVTALIYCTRSNSPVRMSIHHCRKCDKYYINATSYHQYARKYGLPMLRLVVRRQAGSVYFNDWNKESELAAYGYSASENNGAIDSDRQRLLADLVDSGLMTKSEIVAWLEFLIRTRKNLDSLIVQKRRKDDLEFLNQYHINEQRFVWAKITPNKKRRR